MLYFSSGYFDFSCLEYQELSLFGKDSKFSKYLSLPVGSISDDSSAIIGHQGHIFINDGANNWVDQLLGLHSNANSAVNEYEILLEARRLLFRDLGIFYKHLIVPEKDVIYPDLNPNLNSASLSEDRVAMRLATSEFNDMLHYSYMDLLDVKKYGFVFLKRNSHLNFFGGYFVAKNFLKSIGFDLPDIIDIDYKIYKWPDDLSMKFVDDLNTSRPVLVTHAQVKEISEGLNGGHVGRKIIFSNQSASVDKKLLIFGDSYSWNPDAGFARFASLIFKEVMFVWSASVDFKIVQEFAPDYVVTESAERFHIKPPVDKL